LLWVKKRHSRFPVDRLVTMTEQLRNHSNQPVPYQDFLQNNERGFD